MTMMAIIIDDHTYYAWSTTYFIDSPEPQIKVVHRSQLVIITKYVSEYKVFASLFTRTLNVLYGFS